MRLALALLLIATTAGADTYTLDPKQTELVVRTFKEGFAARLAHNHVIQATDFTGELTWDPEAPQKSKLSVTVDVAALVADTAALRKKYGEPNSISSSDRRKVTEAMLDEGQLDVRKFPTITFVSSAFEKAGDAWQVSGRLTIHGVTKNVRLPVKIAAEDAVVTGEGVLRFRTSDFGIKPYSAALGTIRNKDEVELVLHLVASPPVHPERSRGKGQPSAVPVRTSP